MNKSTLLNMAVSDDEKLLFSKAYDLYLRCENGNYTTYSSFLTPAEQARLSEAFKDADNIEFFGGYTDAERKMMSFSPFCNYEEKNYPISAVRITTKDKKVFSHRDYLGSLLNLGIKREKTGDIIISDDHAVIMCTDDICQFLVYNYKKIGHANIFVEKIEETCYNFIKQFKEVNYTVSSMRLDAVVSAFAKKSRGVSSELIKKGMVNLNYVPNLNVSHTVKDGDVISAKGFGKAIIQTDNTLTRKGRINITVKYYV